MIHPSPSIWDILGGKKECFFKSMLCKIILKSTLGALPVDF